MTLSSRAREKLYDAQAATAAASGRGPLPICNICDTPIDGTRDRWNESHDPAIPKHLGGEVTGIAHERCNFLHNNLHDTPLYAKVRRQRQKFIGASRTSRPMLGSRLSGLRKRMDGTVERRT